MQKPPFVENFENLEITTHNIAFSNPEWEIHPFDNIRGTTFSSVWINHSEHTDIVGSKGLTTSLTLIIRNQSNLKNVIICFGIFTTKQISLHRTPEKELAILIQYLFDKVELYKIQNDIKGVDGLIFKMPEYKYSDHQFEYIVKVK